MKLKDFPLLAQCMEYIMWDQPRPGGTNEINMEAEIREWEAKSIFEKAENGLTRVTGKVMRDVLTADMRATYSQYAEIEPEESALGWFALPVDEIDEVIADTVGMKPSEFWAAKMTLEKFFDGPYRERFHKFTEYK